MKVYHTRRVVVEFRQTSGELPKSAELIKLRFFVGLTNPEAARALGISERSAKRFWAFGRAWLFQSLRDPSTHQPHDGS